MPASSMPDQGPEAQWPGPSESFSSTIRQSGTASPGQPWTAAAQRQRQWRPSATGAQHTTHSAHLDTQPSRLVFSRVQDHPGHCLLVTDLAHHTTQLNSTQLNSTQLNSTQLNSTQLNSTQLNSTQLNSTQLNSTQLNSTQLNSTQLNSTQLNSTQLNSTQFNSTQLNSTQLNSTQYNTTSVCCNAVWHSATCNISFHAGVWCGVVQCGVAWRGVVWCFAVCSCGRYLRPDALTAF